jgi:IS605 OrfB family transposase
MLLPDSSPEHVDLALDVNKIMYGILLRTLRQATLHDEPGLLWFETGVGVDLLTLNEALPAVSHLVIEEVLAESRIYQWSQTTFCGAPPEAIQCVPPTPVCRLGKKAVRKLAKLHRQIRHQRSNTLHQVTTRLAKTKSVLVIEDLYVAGMLKNHHLAQAIGDVGFYEFKRQLLYKASWYGSRVILADRWEPSSKRCSSCDWIDADLTLADRILHCEKCGLVRDRDLNAAINLEKLAGSFLGQSKRLWSHQRWREAYASCETGGREAGTQRQGWRVHAWVSLGERI